MQGFWIKKDTSDKLLVVVLGWASDYHFIEHQRFDGCDVLAVYDYRDMISYEDNIYKRKTDSLSILSLVERYPERYLVAWSFGVWVSEQLFGNVVFDKAIAVNGTPIPLDEDHGLGKRRFDITLNGVRRNGMETFNERMFGVSYEDFRYIASPRSLEENIRELDNLGAMSSIPYDPSIKWSAGVVGQNDVIFSPEKMVAFWGIRAKILPLPHYPFAGPDIIQELINDR